MSEEARKEAIVAKIGKPERIIESEPQPEPAEVPVGPPTPKPEKEPVPA